MHQNSMILSPPIPIVQKFNITNMGLREIGAALPPGFRFCPSDEELVCHYLYRKIANDEVLKESTLMEIDLHTCEPWQLPEFKELRINLPNSLKDLQFIWDFSNRSTVNDVLVCETAKLNSTEWYFFSFRDRKYATGFRTNRATTSGYWKATGKDRTIINPKSNAIVGMRKTLVFYENRAPNGIKTGWIMHEFRLENPHLPPKEDWVLCRVFHKAKTENNNEMSPQNVFETEAPSSYTSPVVEQNPNNLQDLSPLNPNFLQLSHGNEMMINSKCEEEEYGFLFRMSFEESNLGDGMVSKMEEETRFEDDHGLMFH